MQKSTEIQPPRLEPKRVSNIQQYLRNVVELLQEMEKENKTYLEKLEKEIFNIENHA